MHAYAAFFGTNTSTNTHSFKLKLKPVMNEKGVNELTAGDRYSFFSLRSVVFIDFRSK